MDAIWSDARAEIAYREAKTGDWRFKTAYFGDGRYMLTIGTLASTETQLHFSREELETLGDAVATALGGCLYLADEDRDSEMGP
jgi:hypothetical protein